MLSAPPPPSSHDDGALAKLSSCTPPSRSRCPGCERRSLATAARDEGVDGRRSTSRWRSMIAGHLVVGEEVPEHRSHVDVEAHSPAKRGRYGRVVSRASEGRAARRCSGSGRIQSPHGGRRCRTSSGLTARRTGRCCRPGVAVPPPTTFGFFVRLLRGIFTERDRGSRTRTCPENATQAVRPFRLALRAVCARPEPRRCPGRAFTFTTTLYQ